VHVCVCNLCTSARACVCYVWNINQSSFLSCQSYFFRVFIIFFSPMRIYFIFILFAPKSNNAGSRVKSRRARCLSRRRIPNGSDGRRLELTPNKPNERLHHPRVYLHQIPKRIIILRTRCSPNSLLCYVSFLFRFQCIHKCMGTPCAEVLLFVSS